MLSPGVSLLGWGGGAEGPCRVWGWMGHQGKGVEELQEPGSTAGRRGGGPCPRLSGRSTEQNPAHSLEQNPAHSLFFFLSFSLFYLKGRGSM